mmetsp:Transcript_97129/g.277955  ORF Transcript_97129/g.277955 Transcript_97129/m.277955 type:complete len:398 (+) Transcript_97129:419-1612(+)
MTKQPLSDIYSAFAVGTVLQCEVVHHPSWTEAKPPPADVSLSQAEPFRELHPDILHVLEGAHANHSADIFGVANDVRPVASVFQRASDGQEEGGGSRDGGSTTVRWLGIDKVAWGGLPFEVISGLGEQVAQEMAKGSDLLVVLANAARVHLYQVHNWERRGLVRSGTYTQLMGEVRRRYDAQQQWQALGQPSKQGATCTNESVDGNGNGGDNVVTVAVHMRRGDLVGVDKKEGGDAGYYRSIIDQLRRVGGASGIKLEFTIYTEKHGVDSYSEGDARRELGMDVAEGGKAGATGFGDGSTTLRLVIEYCLYEHFEAMASADVVVLSRGPHGSLSDMLGYFAEGVVLLHVEERMLRYSPLPPRWHSVSGLGIFNDSAAAASLAALREAGGRRRAKCGL